MASDYKKDLSVNSIKCWWISFSFKFLNKLRELVNGMTLCFKTKPLVHMCFHYTLMIYTQNGNLLVKVLCWIVSVCFFFLLLLTPNPLLLQPPPWGPITAVLTYGARHSFCQFSCQKASRGWHNEMVIKRGCCWVLGRDKAEKITL